LSGNEEHQLGAEERDALDAIVERLIPTDETGPGAREAGVSRYILQALASDYSGFVEAYRDGLASLDSTARERAGGTFAAIGAEGQDALLVDIEAGRIGPPSLSTFFETVRQHAMEGMFGDPRWGGNIDQAGWKLLGYEGPKPVWSAAEQQLGPSTPAS
jgi:gluconate 2-dehydrogenase gamma chain